MLSIAFWNIHKSRGSNVVDAIIGLASDICLNSDWSGPSQEVIFCLGEPQGIDEPSLLERLQNTTPGKKWWIRQPASTKRFLLLGTVAENAIDISNTEIAHALPCSLTRVNSSGEPKLYDLWFVHLSAPNYAWNPATKRRDEAVFLREMIEDRELKKKPEGTLAIGDFNIEPFNEAMLDTSALNATPCRHVAQTRYKQLRPEKLIQYFFNPMWEHLGSWSSSRQPGTFHRKEPGHAMQWHVIDHVLVRPSLIGSISTGMPRILTQAGAFSLTKSDGGISEISDHLPVLVSLNI